MTSAGHAPNIEIAYILLDKAYKTIVDGVPNAYVN